MNTNNSNLNRPIFQEKGLVPEPVKLVLILVLLLLVAYLFYDIARTKKANQFQLAQLEDQIRRIENNSKLGEATLSDKISDLKTDLQDTHKEAKAELKKTAAQIQAEGRKTKQELSVALSTKADASQVDAQVEAAKSEAENKFGQVSNEVGGVKTQVVEVKSELEGTQRQLLDMRDSLSAAVARNSTELAQLRLKGERDYFEFTIPKKKAEVRIEDIRLVLTKTDHKKGKFNLKILVDDGQIEKKNRAINEPIQFLVGKDRVRYEVVVNWVQKNKIGGYVSIPKDKTLAAEGVELR
jgi:chromosome segregation ATPase